MRSASKMNSASASDSEPPFVVAIAIVLCIVTVISMLSAYYWYTKRCAAVEKFTQEPSQCIECKKPFQQSPEYRCSTKCFDCVNNHKSLDHLNLSYGNANLYAQ